MTTSIAVPTASDVRALKLNWASDPCWELEETEGYEMYREELHVYAEQRKAQWVAERDNRIAVYAGKLETSNPVLAAYVMGLEQRIAVLEGSTP